MVCALLAQASACNAPREPGAAVRLLAGAADTVVVNNRRPVSMPVVALDASNRVVPASGIHYVRTGGDSLDINVDGVVTCTQRGDATVRASLGAINTEVLLRCRPVKRLHIAGPIQFVLGDSSQVIPLEALGVDDNAVDLIAGTVATMRANVVGVETGLRVTARTAGVSLTEVVVGDEHARVGVHVYEPVTTLDGLRADQRLVSMAMRLESGEMRRWQLPAGNWMLTMMPYEDVDAGLRLRVEGAVCVPARLTIRRIVCESKERWNVVVYNPSPMTAPARTGSLLVKR
jgi:hypothetical protein